MDISCGRYLSLTLVVVATMILHPSTFPAAADGIPAQVDGFVYENHQPHPSRVLLEAYLDPLCHDSRDSWPGLKQIFRHYYPRLALVVHMIPTPYHDNSFLASRALHVAHKLNSSTVFPLIEKIFNNTDSFVDMSNKLSRNAIVDKLANTAFEVVGGSLTDVRAALLDESSENAAIVSFQFGTSREVIAVPFFYINGFKLPGQRGEPLNLTLWQAILDPIMAPSRK